MLLNAQTLIPGNCRHVVGKNWGAGPQAFQAFLVNRRVGGVEQKHIDGIIGNHALHVTK